MAIEDFKAQFKPKFKIELVSADHQNKADVGSNKVREWYDTQGVDMVTDVLNSGVAIAVAKVTTEKNKIMLNTGAASTRLTNEDCAPNNVVHYVYDTYALANGPGKAVTKQGKDSWFFLTADYAFGHSLEKDTSDAVKANGGKVLGAVRHPLNASDFSSFLLQAQASKAKVVGLANAGGDTINSIKAANEFGLTKNQTVVGLLTTITDIHALGLPTTQGMMFTEGFYWNLNKETREFSRRFFSKHKAMPNMLPAGHLFGGAALPEGGAGGRYRRHGGGDEADEGDADQRRFAKGGKIRDDGRMIHDMYLVEVKKQAESKEPWDYYNVKQVIPAERGLPADGAVALRRGQEVSPWRDDVRMTEIFGVPSRPC
jgi:branched-chain amino acid transport system substrate-binding protein